MPRAVVLEQLDGVLAGCRRTARSSAPSRRRRRRRSPPAARGSCDRSRAALSASMTCAKSLTGAVSSGKRRRLRAGAEQRAAAGSSATARAQRTSAAPRTPNAAADVDRHFDALQPSTYCDQPLDRVEVRREQALGVGRRRCRARRRARRPRRSRRRRRRARVRRGARPRRHRRSRARRAARRCVSERRERRRRLRRSARTARRRARASRESLRAGAAGGCAPAPRRRAAGRPASTREAANGFAPGDDRVVGEDRAELERKRVERSLELVRGEQQRRGQAGVVPRVDARRAGAQVVARHARRRRPACASAASAWPCAPWRRRARRRAAAVDDAATAVDGRRSRGARARAMHRVGMAIAHCSVRRSAASPDDSWSR